MARRSSPPSTSTLPRRARGRSCRQGRRLPPDAFPSSTSSPKGACMLLAIDAGNTNVVFALVEGGEIKTRWRIATDPRRTADEYAVWLHQLLELEGFGRDDVDAGDHRHGRAARAAQSGSAQREIFRRRAAGRRAGRGRMADRARRRGAAKCRRRPGAQRHRRPRQAPGRPDRHRFRHRDDLRRGRFLGRLQGRDHRAGHQPQPRRAGRRRGQAAAHRHRRAARTKASSDGPRKRRC